jgi:hypothetical protein
MTRRYVLFGSICCAFISLEEAADDPFNPATQCEQYLQTKGCGWTQKYHCPGQPAGPHNEGLASDDQSQGYKCCCTFGLWHRSPTNAAPAPVPVAPAPPPVDYQAPVPKAFQAKVGGSPKVAYQKVVPFGEETITFGDVYDASASSFKATVAGTYFFNFVIYAHNADSPDEFHFYRQHVDTGVGCINLGDSSTPCAASYLVELVVGETVDVRSLSTGHTTVRPLSSFSALRLNFGITGGYGKCAFQEAVKAGTASVVTSSMAPNPICSYSGSTFTAQKKAVYYFSFSVPTTESTLPLNVSYSFYVNGVSTTVGCFRAAASRESCSAALIKVLNPRDSVTVVMADKTGAFFSLGLPTLTYFQGMLLREATATQGTAFDLAVNKAVAPSNDLVFDQPLLARSDSTWYTKQKWYAPAEGNYFFSIYVLSDKAGGEIQFTNNGNNLGLGCYDDGSLRRVCRANAILHVKKGETIGLRSTTPVAPQSENGLYVSQYLAFQIDEANADGTVQEGCFTKGKQFSPDLEGSTPSIQGTEAACQTHCYQTAGCAHFSWNTADHKKGRN